MYLPHVSCLLMYKEVKMLEIIPFLLFGKTPKSNNFEIKVLLTMVVCIFIAVYLAIFHYHPFDNTYDSLPKNDLEVFDSMITSCNVEEGNFRKDPSIHLTVGNRKEVIVSEFPSTRIETVSRICQLKESARFVVSQSSDFRSLQLKELISLTSGRVLFSYYYNAMSQMKVKMLIYTVIMVLVFMVLLMFGTWIKYNASRSRRFSTTLPSQTAPLKDLTMPRQYSAPDAPKQYPQSDRRKSIRELRQSASKSERRALRNKKTASVLFYRHEQLKR